MRPGLVVIVAGGTFAAAAIAGLLVGVGVANWRGQPLLAPAGLLVGAAIGGYSALRLMLRSIR